MPGDESPDSRITIRPEGGSTSSSSDSTSSYREKKKIHLKKKSEKKKSKKRVKDDDDYIILSDYVPSEDEMPDYGSDGDVTPKHIRAGRKTLADVRTVITDDVQMILFESKIPLFITKRIADMGISTPEDFRLYFANKDDLEKDILMHDAVNLSSYDEATRTQTTIPVRKAWEAISKMNKASTKDDSIDLDMKKRLALFFGKYGINIPLGTAI